MKNICISGYKSLFLIKILDNQQNNVLRAMLYVILQKMTVKKNIWAYKKQKVTDGQWRASGNIGLRNMSYFE